MPNGDPDDPNAAPLKKLELDVLEPVLPAAKGPSIDYPSRPGRIQLQREWMRGGLALGLFLLLASVVIISLFMALDQDRLGAVEKILEKTVSPLVALVSAATGFYFGSEAKSAVGGEG